jgi:hypothetical protein
MENKSIKYTFGGANQDISKSKHPAEFYFEAGHIRIVTTDGQTSGNAVNEKGNELILEIPNIIIYPKAVPAVKANNESLNLIKYGTIIIPVLNNDSFTYPVTLTLATSPLQGNATVNVDKTITYVHTGTLGVDSFTYTINDGFTSSTATVTINVSNTVINVPDPIVNDNFDGKFYRYVLSPCDINYGLMRVKSINKITDYTLIYYLTGSGNIGKEGKIAYKDTNLSSTPHTISYGSGVNCPQSSIIYGPGGRPEIV